jgi:hypothetical protein
MVLIVLMTAVIEVFQDMDQNRRDVLELEVVLRDKRRDRALDRRENVPIRGLSPFILVFNIINPLLFEPEVDLILVDIVVIEENTQSLDLEVLEIKNSESFQPLLIKFFLFLYPFHC